MSADSVGKFATDLRFVLNGSEVVIDKVDPSVLLVDWLRSPAVGLTGTKKSCAQGGCGACTVMLSRWDDLSESVEHLSLNSCLRPLCSLDGMEITTTEGTGNCRSELSPVQYRIAKENGSQCGFCTPGFVMNMTAFLATNQEQTIGQKEIEDLFDGNLCRCTGYRSILYGMKHFASDWGPDDEAGCLKTVVDPSERVPHARKVRTSFPKKLQRPPRPVYYAAAGYHWYRPTSLEQVHAIIAKHPDVANVKLVGGNTSIGVYDHFVEDPHVLIDISQLDVLRGIEAEDDWLSFGSAVTYGELLDELDILVDKTRGARLQGLEALRYMARRTAGTIVRNAATVEENRKRMKGLPYEGFSEAYRIHLAESYFYQFFVHVAELRNPGSIPADLRSAGERYVRPVTAGKQSYEKFRDEYPVDLPLVKLAAFLQATGEACYTHDLAIPERTMEAAVVTSAKTLAKFSYRIPAGKSFKPVKVAGLIAYLKQKYDGFYDFVTASDIPKGGGQSSSDPVFAIDQVNNYGQCIGLVLARTEQLAIDIAQFVSTVCIDYAPAGKPILTIGEAVRKKSIFKDINPYPVHIWKIRRPGSDFSWADSDQAVVDGVPCEVVRGTQESGAQIHFYMETQACVAIPGERDEIVLYSSCQSPDGVQSAAAGILGVPQTRVDVKVNRVGGGYGGKTTRSPYVSSAVAVAAAKHHQPVRLAVRRENDSAMIGHRHPLYSKYAVAIADSSDPDQHGRIVGMHTDFTADGGSTYDCSFVVMDCIQLRADSAYMVKNYGSTGEVAQTNKASNGAMRSMGLVQGLLAQEDAIECAAHRIGMLPEDVRGKNLYQQGQLTPYGEVVDYCYLDRVWERIAKLSDFDRRRAEVQKFNRENRWRKRGISMIPVKYGSGYNATFLEQAGA